jgi:hypothetical protein
VDSVNQYLTNRPMSGMYADQPGALLLLLQLQEAAA